MSKCASNSLLWLFCLFVIVSCGGRGSSNTSQNAPEIPSPGLPASCLAGDHPIWNSTPLNLVRVFPNINFNNPTGMYQIPGSATNDWIVIEKSGRIFRFANNPDVTQAEVVTVLDIQDNVASNFEGGLLGMAFDPNFASNRFVYISYTTNDTPNDDSNVGTNFRSVISRVVMGGDTINMNSEKIILEQSQPFGNHNGGHIAFGSDGFLYIGFGDGGGSNTRSSQDTTNRLGSMLRIDVTNMVPDSIPYTIPPGNPLSGSCNGIDSDCPEIYAWGFRNPWRWSFDRLTHDLWVADVGQNTWEEINRVEIGQNYGWPCYEATHEYGNSFSNLPSICNGNISYSMPIYEYNHSVGISVTGGYVYRGTSAPTQVGQYIFGDFAGGIWSMSDYLDTPQVELVPGATSVVSFAEDNSGEVYALRYSGSIHKLVSDGNTSNTNITGQLSATGCAQYSNPKLATSNMIPYDINAKLWSDGTSKSRWFALPKDGKITIESDGDWSFPIGSVLRKDFYLNGNIIETRLLAHHNDGTWGGYSYEWNARGSDATVVVGGLTKTIASQEWTYPSELQCFRCHTSIAGETIGPETGQLNRDFTYPNGQTHNQLDYYESQGFFVNQLPVTRERIADPADMNQTQEERARAYLHVNCAHCHQPGGTAPAPIDINFRYDASSVNMNVCNALPVDDLGISGARLLYPGIPSLSIISVRMHSLDTTIRMPDIGSVMMDSDGTTVIDNWIMSYSACP